MSIQTCLEFYELANRLEMSRNIEQMKVREFEYKIFHIFIIDYRQYPRRRAIAGDLAIIGFSLVVTHVCVFLFNIAQIIMHYRHI